jgi:L-histidine Nalpha-methyltransferase
MSALAYNLTQFSCDVRRGLSRSDQKELPPSYLYDALGSALFEAITLLPEYGLTRADARLLQAHAAEIASSVPPGTFVAELGSGTGTKTRHILEALGGGKSVDYYPIDVSAAALRACAAELEPVARIHPRNASYIEGLKLATRAREPQQNLLLLFLGSTIGNFSRDASARFLAEIRSLLSPGDTLLIGADLVKPIPVMVAAYDDPAGVTAAFNKNILGRINRELGANFDLRKFEHEARWNERYRRIEMHLRSTADQTVELPGADLTVALEDGETIWTESSHKFKPAELESMASSAGFRQEACWVDRGWPFAECMWRAS